MWRYDRNAGCGIRKLYVCWTVTAESHEVGLGVLVVCSFVAVMATETRPEPNGGTII